MERFNAAEILKIAVRVEEEGRRLYAALEDKAKDKKLKLTWQYLKEEERRHGEVFQEILKGVKDGPVYEFSPGEYAAYLKAIAASYIFTEELIEKKIKELFKTDLEAIDFAISIEKESILTYSALRESVPVKEKETISKVIAEEKRHLTQLTLLR